MSEIIIRSEDIKMVPLSEIKLNPKNRNKHPKEQIDRIAEIIKYSGFRRPLTISNQSGNVSCGEGRFLAAKKLGMKELPVTFQDYDNEDQEVADGIADNALQEWSELDLSEINLDVADLGPDFDIKMLGFENFEIEPADKEGSPIGNLSDKFLFPPFSILNARCGEWQDRKRAWIAIGIQSELGRGGGAK